MFIKQPFDEFLGFEYRWLNDGELELTLKIKELFVNSMGVIHGGIISTLADVAMSNLMPANEGGVQEIVTVDLKTSFLRPAKGEFLRGKARVVKNGRKLLFAECEVYNDRGDLVAVANGIFARYSS